MRVLTCKQQVETQVFTNSCIPFCQINHWINQNCFLGISVSQEVSVGTGISIKKLKIEVVIKMLWTWYLLKYYQNELELSSITASHTVLLNRESLREHPMDILLKKDYTRIRAFCRVILLSLENCQPFAVQVCGKPWPCSTQVHSDIILASNFWNLVHHGA